MSNGPNPPMSQSRDGRSHARSAVRSVLSALLLLTGLASPRAGGKDITWAVYDAPPFMITSGPDADQGVFDRIRHLLDTRLSDMSPHTLRAPFPRVLASLKDGAELCFIGGVETPERDGFAVFSLPIAMFYPLRIVVHAPERKRFEARAPLSLATLLADHNLRTSTLRDRSLGQRIDALFQKAGPTHVHSEFGEAFHMLLTDRLDYLVEYSAIAGYQAKALGYDDREVLALPFSETPEPVFSRVMCPKTDWGRHLVGRVNAILEVERRTPAYRNIVEAWADDGDLPTIRDVYDHVLLESK